MDTHDDEIKHRVQSFDDNLPEDQRNPHAKETFDKLIARAAQPVQSKPETPAQSEVSSGLCE
jgi:hypothetical protein